MTTIAQLKASADHSLFAEDYASALASYARIVELQPTNLDARLRVADSLLSLGEVQRAAVVYTALSRHAALAGYPLRALCALKIVAALEPKLNVLLQDIAQLYARGSARLGRSVRKAPPDPEMPVADAGIPPRTPEQAEQLAAAYESAHFVYPEKLIPIPLLSLLDVNEFSAVLSALQVVRARTGTALLREGEPGHSFFVLARGSVEVTTLREGKTTSLAKLNESAIFGEMALLSQAPRAATITALTDCDLLEFDVAALSDASSTLTHLASALATFAQERLLNNVFATSAIFQPLDGKQRSDLMRRFIGVEVPMGEAVIKQGQPGLGLYVILRGEMVVERAEDGGMMEIAKLGPGDMCGEMSLMTHEPTTANVSAGQNGASLLFLGRDYFDRLIQAMPELRTYLERLTEERMLDQRLSFAALAPIMDEIEEEALAAVETDEIEVDVPL